MNEDHVERLKGFRNDWEAERQQAQEKLHRYLALPEAREQQRPGWLESQIQATDAYITACAKCMNFLEREIARWQSEA